MLIILPPSETKRASPEDGVPVALDALSFPELTPTRARIADALVETSGGLDAFARLGVRPTLVAQVARNIRLLDLPALPTLEVYTGPLHEGLDAATLSPAARRRAEREVVVVSPLWGALRPADRIPVYRLHACARLVGMDRLEPTWREVLPQALGAVAREGPILDLRSPGYQALGMPANAGERAVAIRVAQRTDGGRRIGDVVAKRVRGEAARHLLESGVEPDDASEIAAVLGERWPVSLERDRRTAAPWTLTLIVSD